MNVVILASLVVTLLGAGVHAASIKQQCPGDFSCTHSGRVYCGHIPCPLEPCDVTLVMVEGACCPHCPSTTGTSNSYLEFVA